MTLTPVQCYTSTHPPNVSDWPKPNFRLPPAQCRAFSGAQDGQTAPQGAPVQHPCTGALPLLCAAPASAGPGLPLRPGAAGLTSACPYVRLRYLVAELDRTRDARFAARAALASGRFWRSGGEA